MGLLRIPDNRLVDIDDVGDLDPAEVCIISTGSQGEPMSALALMAADENRWIKLGPDDVVVIMRAPDPGQRVQRQQGHRRAGPGRRRGRALGHRGRARHRPRQAGGAQDLPLDRPARLVRPGARRVPPPGGPRPPRQPDGHARATTSWCARTATSCMLTDEGLVPHARVPAGYLYVDGIVGDVGNGRAARPPGAGRGGRGRGGGGGRRDQRRHHHRARGHHPRLGLRGRGRGPARPCEAAVADASRRCSPATPRHREHPTVRAPGRGQVRQRATPSAAR